MHTHLFEEKKTCNNFYKIISSNSGLVWKSRHVLSYKFETHIYVIYFWFCNTIWTSLSRLEFHFKLKIMSSANIPKTIRRQFFHCTIHLLLQKLLLHHVWSIKFIGSESVSEVPGDPSQRWVIFNFSRDFLLESSLSPLPLNSPVSQPMNKLNKALK